jgi:hypothetical protein
VIILIDPSGVGEFSTNNTLYLIIVALPRLPFSKIVRIFSLFSKENISACVTPPSFTFNFILVEPTLQFSFCLKYPIPFGVKFRSLKIHILWQRRNE